LDTHDDFIANTVDSVVMMNINGDKGKYNGMNAGEQRTVSIQQQPETATTIAMDRRSCSGKTATKNDMVGDFGEKKMSGDELKENSLAQDIHHTTTLFTLSAKAIINTNNSAFIGKIIDVVTEGDEDCQRRAVTSKSHKDTCGLFRDQVERKTTISTMVDNFLEILEVRFEHTPPRSITHEIPLPLLTHPALFFTVLHTYSPLPRTLPAAEPPRRTEYTR